MSASQVPLAKAKVIELLEEADSIADVTEIQYGRQPENPLEFICVADGRWDESTWVNLGPDPKLTERFRITVYIGAQNQGQSQQEATERAFEIYNAVLEITRANISLGDDLSDIYTMQMEPVDWTEIKLKEGFACAIEAELVFHTRI